MCGPGRRAASGGTGSSSAGMLFDDDDDDRFTGKRGTLTCRDANSDARYSFEFEVMDDDSSSSSSPRGKTKLAASLSWLSPFRMQRSSVSGSTGSTGSSSRRNSPAVSRKSALPLPHALPPPAPAPSPQKSSLPISQPLPPPPTKASASATLAEDEDEDFSAAPTASAPAGRLRLNAQTKSVGTTSSASTRAPAASVAEHAREGKGRIGAVPGRPIAPAGRLQLAALASFRSSALTDRDAVATSGGSATTRRGASLGGGLGGVTARLFSTARSRAARTARELDRERRDINALIQRAETEGVPLTLRERRKCLDEETRRGGAPRKVVLPTTEEREEREKVEGEVERINHLIHLRSIERERLAAFSISKADRKSLSQPSAAAKMTEEYFESESMATVIQAAASGAALPSGARTASEADTDSPPSSPGDEKQRQPTQSPSQRPSGSRWAHVLGDAAGGHPLKQPSPFSSPVLPPTAAAAAGSPDWQLPASSFAVSPNRRRNSKERMPIRHNPHDDGHAPKSDVSKDKPRRLSARRSSHDGVESPRSPRALQPAISPTYRNRGMMQATRRLQLLVAMRNLSTANELRGHPDHGIQTPLVVAV